MRLRLLNAVSAAALVLLGALPAVAGSPAAWVKHCATAIGDDTSFGRDYCTCMFGKSSKGIDSLERLQVKIPTAHDDCEREAQAAVPDVDGGFVPKDTTKVGAK